MTTNTCVCTQRHGGEEIRERFRAETGAAEAAGGGGSEGRKGLTARAGIGRPAALRSSGSAGQRQTQGQREGARGGSSPSSRSAAAQRGAARSGAAAEQAEPLRLTDHAELRDDLAVRVGEDREAELRAALARADVLDPLDMGVHVVAADGAELHVALRELADVLRDSAELGRADGGEIRRVREQDAWRSSAAASTAPSRVSGARKPRRDW